MTEQPTALRLADALDVRGFLGTTASQAAAELRRLHAECNDLAHQLNESNERNGRLIAQRDALLKALRPFAAINASIGFTYKDVDRARAAIKAVEEGK